MGYPLITIRHLKIFLTVAETRNMSEAAARLYVSQPTVSQTIGELEKMYKARLFERYPKELFLTEAGRTLRAQALLAVEAFDRLDEVMKGEGERPSLRIGATLTVGSTVLCSILDELRSVRPNVDLSVRVDNTRTIETLLLQNELDAAIVEGIIRREEILSSPIISDCLILVCAPDHPFAARKSVEAEELAGQPFILREQGSGTRALFESFMARRRLPLSAKWECSSATAIKQAVMRGYGLSVLSARLVSGELSRGELCRVNVEGCVWQRSFLLCCHRNKVISDTLRRFLDIAASFSSYGAPCPMEGQL